MRDLGPGDKGSGVLALPRSKTDQEGEGSNLYVCRETMQAVAAWLRVAGITKGPLFRPVRRNGVGDSPLSTSAVRSVIQRRARAAGVTGRVSGHSLRVGSAQSLLAAGASTAELMQAGRWTDERTAVRYAANELAGRGAVREVLRGRGVTLRPGAGYAPTAGRQRGAKPRHAPTAHRRQTPDLQPARDRVPRS